MLGSRRSRSERDATTAQMVFAAFTGALLAAAGFVAVISPVLVGAVHGTGRKGCFTGAVILAAALFCGRVAVTLRRFERLGRLRGGEIHDHVPAASPDGGPDTPGASERPAPSGPAPAAGSAAPSLRMRGPRTGQPSDQPSQPGRTKPDS